MTPVSEKANSGVHIYCYTENYKKKQQMMKICKLCEETKIQGSRKMAHRAGNMTGG